MTECKIWAGEGFQQVWFVVWLQTQLGKEGTEISLPECCISLITERKNLNLHPPNSSSLSDVIQLPASFKHTTRFEGPFVMIAQKDGREILDKL